jgi:WD40 repeat protein
MEAKRWERYRRLLYGNAPLIGGWLRRKTVEWLMEDGTPEAVRLLEEAAARNGDEQIRFALVTALRQLAEQGKVDAQESLCRLAVFHDLALARETAIALSCAPRDASQRALFYFLTEQWEKYESLDFGHSLLRVAYEAGDEKLRQRIGERARGAGWVEWIEMVGGRQKRQLEEMTDREWEVTMEVLSGSGKWAEMWRLAQEAPARWSARLLWRLRDAGWVPEGGAARADYEELARLAWRYTDAGLDSLAWCRAVLEGHKEVVTCLAISPDGRLLASGSTDNTVRLWNLADGAPLRMLEGGGSISCIAISPDGQVMAVGERYETVVRLWSLPVGAPVKTLEWVKPAEVWGHAEDLAFSPDGRILVVGKFSEGGLGFWRMPDGARLSSMEKLLSHGSEVHSLAFSPNGSALASWGSNWMQYRSLDGVSLCKWNMRAYLKGLAISPDGRMIVGGADKTICLWSLPDGAPLRRLEGHEGFITSLAFRPDGRVLASAGWDYTVRLWSMPDGAPLKILKVDSSTVDPMLPNSWYSRLILKIFKLDTRSIFPVTFSPDGRTLASGCPDNAVRLWSLNAFYRMPISQSGIGDMVWAQETLRNGDLNAEERNCLEFVAALIRLRRRFDIQLGEPTRRIEAGEFDIEIEG